MSHDPYARVYLRIVDDPRFAEVYDDDAALATWLRLLLVAEGVWPASPPVPRWVKDQPWHVLVESGLIETLPGDRYRVHGLDAERERRQKQAAAGGKRRAEAAARDPAGQFASDPPADAGTDAGTDAGLSLGLQPASRAKPSRAKPSRAKPSRAKTSTPDPSVNGGAVEQSKPSPRARGTNPRAVARREAAKHKAESHRLHIAYLSGELTEEQHDRAQQALREGAVS